MSSTCLPTLPVPLAELPSLIAENPGKPVTELFQPYRDFEAALRRLYAQEPDNAILKDPHVNVLPLFADHQPQIRVRARDPAAESSEEQDKYIMPLPKANRRVNDSPATVQSLKEFQHNFSVFSESALSELNWDNVVVSGSAVVNCLLPVPKQYSTSKRTLREYYHEKFCPASDVDLFLYGLTDEQAVEKIKEIETKVRDSILAETTTVRTKHAITICSQYPTRHVQIVLRIYKSISEIVTGFDIDCSGAAYDGKQIYCTPRALQAFVTQINHIDLSRRSPSYENRLSKYSHRNFEVYWSELNRSRIDPTIFERSFRLTQGLARLLVLERLPTSDSRDSYAARRRQERGRPPLNRSYIRRLGGNIKDNHEDEIAEWVEEDEVSSYHTFTIPYGPKYHAKKIEKLCYTRDLLLNAEWNQPKDRAVYLHRHPAFFGRVEDVVGDCCGYCPKPQTEEELEVAETESKIYVSGGISFLKDDPGRQEIGSFSPITDKDWTDMAYVGNTTRLCEAIVDGDIEHVEGWLAQEGADPNKRDYTGRSPLHLAVMSSSPKIVQLLVDHKARLVARLADGRTALHLAAERGDAEIVKILMDKSLANEAEEEEKREQRRNLGAASQRSTETEMEVDSDESDDDVSMAGSDGELVEEGDEDDEDRSMATGSFVKVRKSEETQAHDDVVPEESADDPDYYDINVIAWDTPASALHLAVASGHDEVVKLLCSEYGADLLAPVKFLGFNNQATGALLNLVLALSLPIDKAKTMIKTLLGMGATCAQADLHGITVFHRFVEQNASSALETLWDTDKAGCQTALNHLAFPNNGKTVNPLIEAISNGNAELVRKLLAAGAGGKIDFESWLKSAKQSRLENQLRTFEENTRMFKTMTEQPLIVALKSSSPAIALELLHRGADPNTLTTAAENRLNRASWWGGYDVCESALDIVRKQLENLREYSGEHGSVSRPIEVPAGVDEFLGTFEHGTWQYWLVSRDIASRKKSYLLQSKEYQKDQQRLASQEGLVEKKAAIADAVEVLEKIEKIILEKGGKTFQELHPDVSTTTNPWNQHQATLQGTGVDATYQYVFTFQGVTDVTEARKAAYIQLFEAAWQGDLDKIKQLTLGAWDDEEKEPPLQIAVTDNNGNSPFSLAFLRGHRHINNAILEIAQAQYAPPEAPKGGLFFCLHDDPEYSDESDSDMEDSAEPRIYQEILDQQFTIDNIGEVSMQVKSRVKPMTLLTWQCPSFVCSNGAIRQYVAHGRTLFDHAIAHNDGQAFIFLLDLAKHFTAQKMGPGEEPIYSISDMQFHSAISRGHTELMAEMIRRTGVGLPLEDLIKETGIEVTEKPRYYQGLTVYGKKRSDWAQAGRDVMRPRATGSTTPPLIYAASAGSLESVEWFLSDAPLRHYLSFAKSEEVREDSRMKRLSQAPGGSDRVITAWLGNQRDLLIHAAIMGIDLEKALRLVEYLVRAWPSSMNAKSSYGYTPLQLACLLGRVDIAKLLIQNGADQSTREQNGENILHSALKYGDPAADQLKICLDLIDPGLRSHLFLQRTQHNSGGRTPLHFWAQKVARQPLTERIVEVLRLLLSYSGGAELDMLDGAGDTVLHSLISCDADPDLIRVILDVRPELLYRENAVGRTPAELARDRFMSACIRAPPVRYTREDPISNITSRSPESFMDRRDPSHHSRSRCEAIWDLVKVYMETFPGRRALVSLNDANEVAKRLGDGFQGRRYAARARESSEKGDVEEQKMISGQEDIVAAKMHDLGGLAWPKIEKEKKEAEEASKVASDTP